MAHRTASRLGGAALVATAVVALLVATAFADSLSIDFNGYTVGSIHNQDGWSSSGSAGSGCAVYDHAVALNTYGYATFGSKTLRMSNAVTSGCFGDQTFSKSLADEAGETTAEGGGLSGGTRQGHFEAEWEFASTVPGAEQPGLSVVASPDRGDGARMSWVQMADTPAGLEVNFYDYQHSVLDFVFTNLASGLSRGAPHTILITMDFFDGAENDVVKVYVDGALKHTGTSWEDYFRDVEGNATRTVDSILFRTGGAAVPATAGNGFVIDNLTLGSGDIYSFVGFAAPVDNGVPNVAKAGQAVPLKWRVLDSQGDPVTDITDVTLTATSLTCDLGSTVDQIEEYATGGSGLQNLGDGYYQFNWKTPKSYARSCKTLSLDLGDGIPRTAEFYFTR